MSRRLPAELHRAAEHMAHPIEVHVNLELKQVRDVGLKGLQLQAHDSAGHNGVRSLGHHCWPHPACTGPMGNERNVCSHCTIAWSFSASGMTRLQEAIDPAFKECRCVVQLALSAIAKPHKHMRKKGSSAGL